MTRHGPLFVVAAIAVATGCRPASGPSLIGSDNAWFAVHEMQPAQGVVRAGDLVPPAPTASRTFVVIEDAGIDDLVAMGPPTAQHTRVNRDYRASDRFGATWTIACDDGREEFLTLDDEGNTLLTAVIEHRKGAITYFDPPLRVASPELRAGEVVRDEVAMRVVDLKDPRREKEKGTATREIEYVGDQLLRTPEGEMLAQRVEITFTADMKLADVTARTTALIVPGLGVIAEERTQKITILGVLGRESRRLTVMEWEAN